MLKWGWLLACLAWCLLSKSCTTAKAKNKEPSVERKRAQQREIIESVEVDHAGESVTQKVKKGGSKKKVSKKTGSTKAKGNGEGSKPKKKLKSKTTLGSTSRILLASEEAELTPVLTDDPRTPAKTIKDGTGFAVTGRPVPVHRVPVAEMTRERLEYALHHGELLLIEGGAKAWPAMTKWNLPWYGCMYGCMSKVPTAVNMNTPARVCRFEKLFPNAAVEFRHAGSPAHNAQVGQITLKTYRKAAKKIGQPWYIGWGNQDEEASKRYFQPYMKTPAYFPASFESQGFRTGCNLYFSPVALVYNHFVLIEWMYFGSHLSGVGWHQDPQCHPKISIHMGGDKLWRLHAPWRHRNLGNTTATESIIWEMVIKEGDIFIFYPQYLHNTVVLGVNGSMAYTAYIETPRETPFIRELINVHTITITFTLT